MNSFSMFEDAALQSRVGRLKLEEQDVAERVAEQMAALETEGRWHKSDPLYQRLSFALKGIREDLRNIEGELARRANTPRRRGVSATTSRARRMSYAQLVARVLKRFAQPAAQPPASSVSA